MKRCPTCGQPLPEDERAANRVRRTIRETQEAHAADVAKAAKDAGRKRDIENAQNRLADLKAARNPHHARLRETEQQAVELTAEIRLRKKNLKRARVNAERVRYWIKGFRELRLWLVEESLAQLEIEANAALYALGLEGWRMQFDVERETKAGGVSRGFTVLVESPESDGAVPWESWSGGESQRLRIACEIGLANLILAQRGAAFDLEMWDEPSSWLTEEGVESLLRLLRERARESGRKVLVADHRALGFGGFSRTLFVEKGKNGSQLKGNP